MPFSLWWTNDKVSSNICDMCDPKIYCEPLLSSLQTSSKWGRHQASVRWIVLKNQLSWKRSLETRARARQLRMIEWRMNSLFWQSIFGKLPPREDFNSPINNISSQRSWKWASCWLSHFASYFIKKKELFFLHRHFVPSEVDARRRPTHVRISLIEALRRECVISIFHPMKKEKKKCKKNGENRVSFDWWCAHGAEESSWNQGQSGQSCSIESELSRAYIQTLLCVHAVRTVDVFRRKKTTADSQLTLHQRVLMARTWVVFPTP